MEESEILFETLTRIGKVTKSQGANILRSLQMSRKDRELLLRKKWLVEIIKGWYLLTRPDISPGDSSIWYASFFDFLRIYLHFHYKDNYCFSAENSLDLHTGNTAIPKQVIVISQKGGGSPQEFPFLTSLFVYSDPKKIPQEKTLLRGLQVMSLPYALCKVSATYFSKNSKDAEIALRLIRSSSELTSILLKYNLKSAAARLLGAYDFLGDIKMCKEIQADLLVAGWKIKKGNPFSQSNPILSSRQISSPYVGRIQYLWNEYRKKIIDLFPKSPGLFKNSKLYLKQFEDLYEKDAYNSLSIEGYQVDEDLIQKVQNNHWNPQSDLQDQKTRDRLAARGYYEAFLEVKKSLLALFKHGNPGKIIQEDLKKWYQHLFSPLVRAGILKKEDLLGYRRNPVYIRNSRHVPLPKEALLGAMDTLFTCLKKEKEASVRAILGHYIFVFIHPYMDGNGRIARFIMNTMLASGGYPWTIIHMKNRSQYISSLETVITEGTIEPFVKFILKEMKSS